MKYLDRERTYFDADEREPRMTLNMLLLDDSGRELMPEELLVAAILKRAHSDLKSKGGSWRSEAVAFFCGHRGSLDIWCHILGLDPRVVSQLALGNTRVHVSPGE